MKDGGIRTPRIRRSRLEQVAHHEAGHGVVRHRRGRHAGVGHRLGLKLVDGDVLADGEGGNGHTNFETPAWFRRDGPIDDRKRAFIEAVATTFLAGTIAEARLAGYADWEAPGFDLDSGVPE